jgi:hypothetical protein
VHKACILNGLCHHYFLKAAYHEKVCHGWDYCRTNRRWRNRNRDAPASLAHSAAIYVRVEGTRDLFRQDRAKANARAWIARLDELDLKLRDENLHFLAVENDKYDPDMAYLLKSRDALQGAIRMAREYYLELSR